MAKLISGAFFDLTKPVVDFINNILTKLVPSGEIYLVIIMSLLITYAMKTKNNWNNFVFIMMTIVFFSAFRYFGVGG